jgi:3-hydroxyacyl-[acyl-carrier-protein] dehydratase
MPPVVILDPSSIDLRRTVADRAAIRAFNPQRFEMEQLDAIVLIDPECKLVVGYKDVHADEFWARGHFPSKPLLPGVIMCEAAAQLCSYYAMHEKLIDEGQIMGFGGMENVRFRAAVQPGDRLVLVSQGTRLHRRQSQFTVQGFVGETMAFHADIIGVPLPAGAV